MLTEATNSVCHVYDTKFRDFEEFYEKKPEKNWQIQCTSFCTILLTIQRVRETKLNKPGHNVLGKYDMNNLCKISRKVINLAAVEKYFVARFKFFPDGGNCRS